MGFFLKAMVQDTVFNSVFFTGLHHIQYIIVFKGQNHIECSVGVAGIVDLISKVICSALR